MRVVYYTRPCFLDPALSRARALGRLVELHLVLELAPEGWRRGLFDVAPRDLPAGLLPADQVLGDCFPAGVRAYWRDTASFHLVVHDCQRSIHPKSWWTSRKALRLIRDLHPDVLHLDDVSLRLAWALPELGRLPVVLSVHDPQAHSGEQNWRNDLARLLTFPRVQRFVLHNQALLAGFSRRFWIPPERISVVPLGTYGIFREWLGPAAAPDGPTILLFGRQSPYKGLEVLYRAAPLVAQEVPGLRLVVAGRPVTGYRPPKPPALPNGGAVEVVDEFIPNRRLAELFQQATVVVCPYTDATQSGVVLTAYAFGKPVVATAVGGLPEYVRPGETGELVPPGDAPALAAALARALTDAPWRERLSAGVARLASSELDWDRIAQRTVETYRLARLASAPRPAGTC